MEFVQNHKDQLGVGWDDLRRSSPAGTTIGC